MTIMANGVFRQDPFKRKEMQQYFYLKNFIAVLINRKTEKPN